MESGAKQLQAKINDLIRLSKSIKAKDSAIF